MILEPDTVFGQFKIIRKLGEGGMGEVYLAEDMKLNRRVALKILLSEYFENEDRRQRFIREAKTAAQISNPNVMSIFDMDTAREEKSGKDISYIVMEYIDGPSLAEYISSKSLSTAELLRLSEKIAAGLASAHKLGIVHRDIKTENIKVDANGDPKILDFGLAKLAETASSEGSVDSTNTVSQELTQEGKILGTIAYMSPEQARGEAVDSRSDIFAFGILLYKMFGGKSPFEASDRVSVIAKILEARPAPLRSLNETVPAELERIITKCLQKSPADRYQDTRDLVVDLRNLRRQYDSGMSDSAALTTSGVADVKIKKTWTFSTAKVVGAAVILLIIVAAIIKFGGSSSSTGTGELQAHENALAILGFENNTGDKDLNWLQAGLPDMLQTGLSQGSTANIISRNRILDKLDNPPKNPDELPEQQDCLKAAKSLGASKVLLGSFLKLGDQIRIDARVEDIETGRIILAEKVMGDNPLNLVDDLTEKIAQSLNLKDVMNQNSQVADLTSSSPKAYKEYILGMENYYSNLFDDAIEHFKSAIEEDSTFALPYLRIGMSYAMRGRAQAGVPFFAQAKKYEDHLAKKEQNLLDIYYEVFVNNNFTEGFINLSTFVKNYPEEKEARSLLAVFIYQSKGGGEESREKALAQLDTVLMIDPRYQPAFDRIISIYLDMKNYDKAVEYALKCKEYYPNSPTSYLYLSSIYMVKNQFDKAIDECRQLLKIQPDYINALTRIVRANVLKHDFDEAARWAENIKAGHEDDDIRMMTYYELVANLDNWQGKFKDAFDAEYKNLEISRAANDSSNIASNLMSLANSYQTLGQTDSAMYYGRESSKWAVRFQAFNYPIFLVSMDHNKAPEARELWKKAVEYFKASVPPDFWYISDAINKSFEAMCRADTAAMIASIKEINKMPFQSESQNDYDLGRFLILTGHTQEGLEYLNKLIKGESVTSTAFRYIQALYYIGRGYEDLGQNADAAGAYEEFLNYWGKADMKFDMIEDARQRLAKLRS